MFGWRHRKQRSGVISIAIGTVGPYSVKPGEVSTVKYGFPGSYEGYCELSEGKRYEIVVTE